MRFIGYESIQTHIQIQIHILSLSNSHNNVASILKNRCDLIVALPSTTPYLTIYNFSNGHLVSWDV